MTTVSQSIVLATRKSPLALRQAELAARIMTDRLGFEVELATMVTTGDKQAAWSLQQSGGKGLFTKELETAVLNKRADLAVHSAKDLPTEMPEGLVLAGFLPREDPRDVLVVREEVEEPKVIATGSPRRRAQLRERFPNVEWVELRGNVETRLLKIAELGEADATILAAAGLNRLGIGSFPGLRFEFLSIDQYVPAAGQAAIALQCREGEIERFSSVCDAVTGDSVTIERAVLEALGGGCQVAMGVHRRDNEILVFQEETGCHSLEIADCSQVEVVQQVLAQLGKA
ncbi:MAG: hydroxymethylbilane synthase [Opitutales bacterium]|nr:hydroxymethylbilane synthase [Opitutales bacterium]